MSGCLIVMPTATPSLKVNAVRTHGGPTVVVRLFGNNYDEAATEAHRLKEEEHLELIHPFDDPYVIAGQGTIGEFYKCKRVIALLALMICTHTSSTTLLYITIRSGNSQRMCQSPP